MRASAQIRRVDAIRRKRVMSEIGGLFGLSARVTDSWGGRVVARGWRLVGEHVTPRIDGA